MMGIILMIRKKMNENGGSCELATVCVFWNLNPYNVE